MQFDGLIQLLIPRNAQFIQIRSESWPECQKKYRLYRFINSTIALLYLLLSISPIGKLLNTEKAGSDFVRKVVQFFFLKVTENTDLKRKIDVGKHTILSHFLIMKIPGQNTPLIYLLRQIPVGVLLLHCPVKRSKFFCMFLAY